MSHPNPLIDYTDDTNDRINEMVYENGDTPNRPDLKPQNECIEVLKKINENLRKCNENMEACLKEVENGIK